ncbi:TolC family protein [Spirosoma linguale]|uniref:Outer membrane efflux protein n=1 Tax=Spirosoma linguale (strain ATCC 33905 / DSM 74 / LMG 10896 / Claus 1) TaxID=504472 RepID=D2QBY5_SPILD|nr:outer membrane efflux protein [Spirosoma linguale DSM 74]
MKDCQLLIWLVGISSSVTVQAQPLSFADCIDFSLKNHPSTVVYTNNVGMANERAKQALSVYLPQINGSVTYVDNLQLPTTILPAGIFGPDAKEVKFGNQFTANAYLDASQLLYDQSRIYGIRASEPYQQLTELQKEQNRETIIYNTAVAFFQVLIYREQEKILQNNLRNYTSMLSPMMLQVQKGVVLQKDVDRVTVSRNTTAYQINDAQSKEVLALNTLKNAMGLPLTAPLSITDSLTYETFAILPSSAEFTASGTYDYRIGQTNLTLQEIDLQTKKAAFLPTVAAIGRYGQQAYSNDFSTSLKNWYGYSYIGLAVNVPIMSGLRRKSQLEESKLNLENTKINLELSRQSLLLRFENARAALISAFTGLQSNKETLRLAQQVAAVTTTQYQKGVGSIIDFLNDDNAVRNAQETYLSSLLNVLLARLNYEKAQGTLTTYYTQLKN